MQAKTSLRSFIEYLDLGYTFPAHIQLLIAELEALARGDTRCLAIFMPPGSAKSTYASVLFPPWYMGTHPGQMVIGISNTQDLADRFSKRVRSIVGSPEYERIFDGDGLSAETTAAGNWETALGGEYFAAGMGAAIAGRRGDLGIIDDPVKSRAEADSDRIKQAQWDWYTNDFYPRLKPGAKQILIQTRWAEDDLGGRILERDGDKWRVIKLPMLAVPQDPLGRAVGEMLWPEWFRPEMIETAQRDVRAWNALYQQDPIPDEGTYFKRENFSDYDALPEGLHIYGASDYATIEGGGDFTEHGIIGIDPSGNPYVIDWWAGQKSSDVWIEKQCDMIREHQPLIWFGEGGPIRRAIEPFLQRRMSERNAPCRLEWLPAIGDKELRARAIQAVAYTKTIAFPRRAPWKADLIRQLIQFPAGKRDDGVDVMSLFGRAMESIIAPRVKRKPRVLNETVAEGWMG